MRALRIDIGQLRTPKRLADGRLIAEGLLTRAGVFTYRNPDGSERRELRPPEEVFRSDALESFAMAPVTNEHPPELITSKNAKRYAVGAVGENIKRDEDHVRAKLTVYDADTIAQMEAGKASLSCGYEVDVDETPGEHPLYGHYDCIQRNVRGNHVAIVEKGRAGDAARVRMDAAVMLDNVLSAAARNNLPGKEFAVPGTGQLPIENAGHVRAAMARFGQTHFPDAAAKKTAYHKVLAKAKELGIDTKGFESAHKMDSEDSMSEQQSKAAEEQLAIVIKRADDAEKAIKDSTARADKAEAERDAVKARLDALEKEASPGEIKAELEKVKAQLETETKKRLDAEDARRNEDEIKRRVKIVLVAREILGGGQRFDDLVKYEPRQLMAAVLERMPPRFCGGKIEAHYSDQKVSDRFDMAVSYYEAGEQGKQALRDSVVQRKDAEPSDPRSSRERFVARQRALGTEPLTRKEV